MFSEPVDSPDLLDCMLEIHNLKEESKSVPNEKLVSFVVDFANNVDINHDTEMALSRFFNTGSLSNNDRILIENCYVLMKNYLCVNTQGEIYKTFILHK